MPKLHEILAVEKELTEDYTNSVTGTIDTFGKGVLFSGACRTLEMFDDKAPRTAPEKQEMSTTVERELDKFKDKAVRFIDAVLQKECTNQDATADLKVDGNVIKQALPATFLLGLEAKLAKILTVYTKIPTLPSGVKWEKDITRGDDVFKAADPDEKFKTAQTIDHKVLYPATKEHPAQIEKWAEQKNVGKYSMEKWVGFMSEAKKRMLINRIKTLIREVKKARQRANMQEIHPREIGKSLFDFINAES